MNKCSKCGINILDNTQECPLCHSVLTIEQDENRQGTESADMAVSTGMYPELANKVKKFRFVERLVLFLSLVAMFALVLANLFAEPFIAWTVIIGLILIYVNTSLRMIVTGRVGYQSKTLILTFFAVGILIGIDALTGYRGWSLNVVLPSAVMLIDLAALILMLVNLRNWQSYIPLEILEAATCVVMIIFSLCGLITYPNLVYIATLVTLVLLAGTLILGGDRAKRELYRRFHI